MIGANDEDEEEARESGTTLSSRTRILILKTDEVKSKVRRPFSRNKTLGGPRFLSRGNKKWLNQSEAVSVSHMDLHLMVNIRLLYPIDGSREACGRCS
jgi:hypothetical protein